MMKRMIMCVYVWGRRGDWGERERERGASRQAGQLDRLAGLQTKRQRDTETEKDRHNQRKHNCIVRSGYFITQYQIDSQNKAVRSTKNCSTWALNFLKIMKINPELTKNTEEFWGGKVRWMAISRKMTRQKEQGDYKEQNSKQEN